MHLTSTLVFALGLLSLRGCVDAAPAPRDVLPKSTMLHATPRFQNCTSTELQSLNVALGDALYLSKVAVQALSLPEDCLDTEKLSALNTTTVAALTKRWFGRKVLEDTAEGLEMKSYIRSIFERAVDSLANNPSDIDYYCHPPDAPKRALGFVGEIFDLDRGFKYKLPQWGDINFTGDMEAWASSKSLNATLEDPTRDFSLTQMKRNSTFTQKNPLGFPVLHEVVHRMSVNPERYIFDVCVPGHGIFNSLFFSATIIASFDSELALRNAENYVGFAIDLVETLYSGQIPFALLETPRVDWQFLRKQESIDGVLSILPKFDTLKTVTRLPPGYLKFFNGRTVGLLQQLDEFCNHGKWTSVEVEAGVI